MQPTVTKLQMLLSPKYHETNWNIVSENVMKPDPECLNLLITLSIPCSLPALQWTWHFFQELSHDSTSDWKRSIHLCWEIKKMVTWCHFSLITDQKSVSFMFNPKTMSKVINKNKKISMYMMGLCNFLFDVIYCSSKENAVVDALSRVYSSTTSTNLLNLHKELCHLGLTKMLYIILNQNLTIFSWRHKKEL